MKLSVKLAGLFSSGVFILTVVPGFFQDVKPASFEALASGSIPGISILESLGLSLAGAVVAGLIGYWMGEILSRPSGKPKKRGAAKPRAQTKSYMERPVTGEETFLDDLEGMPTGDGPEIVPYTETSVSKEE